MTERDLLRLCSALTGRGNLSKARDFINFCAWTVLGLIVSGLLIWASCALLVWSKHNGY